MSERVRGSQPPPLRVKIAVVRVLTSETLTFCCLSRAAFGQYVHWFGKRSHECKQDKSTCDGCKKGWPFKWKGYLHVIEAGPAGRQCFLEYTATAHSLLEKQAHPGQDFRGMLFRIRRTKGGAKGRYVVEVLERRENPEMLPQEQDPLPTLRFLWAAKNNAGQNEV